MALQFRNGYGLSGAIMDVTTYKRWMGQRMEHFTLSWKGEISSTIEFCIINFEEWQRRSWNWSGKHDDFRPQAEWIALQSKLLVISVSDIKGAWYVSSNPFIST